MVKLSSYYIFCYMFNKVQWHVTCGFDFSRLWSPEGVINGSFGDYGFFLAGIGGVYGLCPESGAWRARLAFQGLSCWEASMIAICGRFCGPGGVNGFCMNYGFFLAWVSPFRAVGSIWAVSKVESLPRACAPCHPKRILLGSFSDTLLVVSILDIIYDCHL